MILFSCSPPWLVQRLSWSTAMFKTRVWLKIWKLNCSLVRFPVFGISYLFWKESWILKLLKQLILSAFPLIALHVLQTHSAFSQLWASLRSWASFTHLATLLAWYLASWLWLWCLLRRYHALGAAPGWVRQLSSLPHWSDWLPPIWELLRRWEKTEWKPNLQRCELSRERLNPPPWGVGCW